MPPFSWAVAKCDIPQNGDGQFLPAHSCAPRFTRPKARDDPTVPGLMAAAVVVSRREGASGLLLIRHGSAASPAAVGKPLAYVAAGLDLLSP
jgi:hypothetical protein